MGQRSHLRDPWLLGLAGLAVLCVPWFLAGPAPLLSTWLVQTALDVLLVFLGWRLARLSRHRPYSLRFWRALQIAMIFCAVGDAYQTSLVLRFPGHTGVSVVQTTMVVLAMSIVAVTMLCHPLGATGRQRLRLWLDAVTVLAGVAVFLWYFTLAPQLSSAHDTDRYAAAASAAVMLVVVFGLLKLVFSELAPFLLGPGIVGSLGVATTALGTSAGLVLTGGHDQRMIFLAQVLSCTLIPISLRMQELQTRRLDATRPADRRRRYSRMPYVAVIAAEVLLVVALPHTSADVRTWGVTIGVLAITALVLGRQLVAFTDNDRLLTDLHEQKEWFRSLVQHASDVTLVVGPGDIIRYASPSATRIFGTTQAVGAGLDIYLHPDDLPAFHDLREELAAEPGTDAAVQVRVRHADGTWRWLDLVGADLTANPSVRGVVYNARDVTEARALQDQLRHEATHDRLTGLANRTLLAEHLAATGPAPVSVLVADLDGFKQINDLHGHHIGDDLLVAVAHRLRAALGPHDLAVRLGGDEFAIILPAATPATAADLAAHLATTLTHPFLINGLPLTVGASIGTATGPADNPDALLREADAAMYRVKNAV
ncbi:diguanylate cyclase domain-containing protein [Actinoplanes sp. NPDC051494]|uniref:diguanylate cyclase domain-containing protein n=1 Tax=Actinoplanes sp. NPDC051494 TaxID=3363907 RepID=UPI0037AFA830